MATKIDRSQYHAMMSALNTFAVNVSEAADGLQSLASACTQAIGKEDKAVPEICKQIMESQRKYADAVAMAKSIISDMQEELDIDAEEDNVWTSSD